MALGLLGKVLVCPFRFVDAFRRLLFGPCGDSTGPFSISLARWPRIHLVGPMATSVSLARWPYTGFVGPLRSFSRSFQFVFISAFTVRRIIVFRTTGSFSIPIWHELGPRGLGPEGRIL